MLQRSERDAGSGPMLEELPAGVPAGPNDVPPHVTDEHLHQILTAGRPRGTETTLAVDGQRFPVVSAGPADGVPVLCVHGLGHDMWDWAPLFARRPDDVRLLALDLPGFGLADKPQASCTLALLCAAIEAVAETAHRPPVVVASSLGGHIAMLSSLARPELYAGLVLLAPGGLIEVPRATEAMLRGYYTPEAICQRREDEIVSNSRRIFTSRSAVCERLAARKLAVHRCDARMRYARPFSAVVDDVFRRPVAREAHLLRPPVEAIFGERDVVVPLVAGRLLEENCRAPLHVIHNVGHTPHLEAPDTTAAIVFDAVARMSGADASSQLHNPQRRA